MVESTKASDTKFADSKSAESKTAEESHQEEIHRLRTRIRELQAKSHEREFRDVADDTADNLHEASDVLRDMPGRAVDEASKFVRGLTMAYMEQLRLMGEMLTTVTEEVSGRNRPGRRSSSARRRSESSRQSSDERSDERSSPSTLAANLPGDILTGVVNALDKTMDGPRRVVDRFYDAYSESDDMDKENREKENREKKAKT